MDVGFVVVESLFSCCCWSGTEAVQRRFPAIGRWPLVEDQDFRVVAGSTMGQLKTQLRDAEAGRIAVGEVGASAVGYEEIKPRVEAYLEEGRRLWVELAGRPDPDRLVSYMTKQCPGKSGLSRIFRHITMSWQRNSTRGNILSPQLGDIAPTDCPNLQVCVERRGQVLRNFLDGTPGVALEWVKTSSRQRVESAEDRVSAAPPGPPN